MFYLTAQRVGGAAPRDDMLSQGHGIDRLFERHFGAGLFGRTRSESWPRVDVVERDDATGVTAELPGYDADDIGVTLEDGVLMITAATDDAAAEGESVTYRLRERRRGGFERRITVPHAVDTERVTACYANGVLTVELPKAESARRRRVQVGGSRDGWLQRLKLPKVRLNRRS